MSSFDASVTASRRARLASRLGDRPALLLAGPHQSRNYPAQQHRYRATSHFLYFVGRPLPGAALLLRGDRATVFAHPPSPDDALWVGEQPGLSQLAEELGLAVEPFDGLAERIVGGDIAALPPPNAAIRLQQRDLLDRDVTLAELGDADRALAEAIADVRLVHDGAAQDGLRRAAEGTTAAHLAGMRATRPGLREHEVRAAMEGALMERGMGTSYGSIVTVHGEVLHNEEHHHELKDGDLLLCDVGAETHDGWAGDVTRTWPVGGRFSTTQAELYDVVLTAQQQAIEAVKPGARYRDVHLTACRALTRGLIALGVLRGDPEELVADGVHSLLFPHGIGHLLGLDVHDMEDLGDIAGYGPGRSRSEQFGLAYLRLDRDLVPGMAVTIEPGLYQVPAILRDEKLSAIAGDRLNRKALARFADVRGIRTEDDILVTESGRENLTSGIPKTREEIEAAVGG